MCFTGWTLIPHKTHLHTYCSFFDKLLESGRCFHTGIERMCLCMWVHKVAHIHSFLYVCVCVCVCIVPIHICVYCLPIDCVSPRRCGCDEVCSVLIISSLIMQPYSPQLSAYILTMIINIDWLWRKQLLPLDQWRQRLLGCNSWVDNYWFKHEMSLNGIWVFCLYDETVISVKLLEDPHRINCVLVLS